MYVQKKMNRHPPPFGFIEPPQAGKYLVCRRGDILFLPRSEHLPAQPAVGVAGCLLYTSVCHMDNAREYSAIVERIQYDKTLPVIEVYLSSGGVPYEVRCV